MIDDYITATEILALLPCVTRRGLIYNSINKNFPPFTRPSPHKLLWKRADVMTWIADRMSALEAA